MAAALAALAATDAGAQATQVEITFDRRAAARFGPPGNPLIALGDRCATSSATGNRQVTPGSYWLRAFYAPGRRIRTIRVATYREEGGRWVPYGSPTEKTPRTAEGDVNVTLVGSLKYELTLYVDRGAADRSKVEGACGGSRLSLDRTRAARFGAIKITGSGFSPGEQVDIYLDGEAVLAIDLQSRPGPDGRADRVGPDGGFENWIWVPDDASFGSTRVWAQEVRTGRRSNGVSLEVTRLTAERLIDNLDAVIARYLETIPANDRWHGRFGSGSVRNIMDAAASVAAPLLHIPTAILTLGTKQDELWPDGKFVCSWYQGEVLTFLDQLRFHPDPKQRALLDGLDYGPFVSGVVDARALSHYYVVVWPHGPALDPSHAEALFGGSPGWKSAGLAFDPWPTQRPAIFELARGTAGWTRSSVHRSRLEHGASYSYWFPRPEAYGYYRNNYPTTGAPYYMPRVSNTPLALPRRPIGGEPPKMLAVRSPVRLEIRDADGNRIGMDARGAGFGRMPGAEVVVEPRGGGRYGWFAALPRGRLEVTIHGTGEGTFQLLVKNAGGAIREYPAVPIRRDETATIVLDDGDAPAPLITPAGEEVGPREVVVVAGGAADDGTGGREAEGVAGTGGEGAGNARTLAADRRAVRSGQVTRVYVRLRNPAGVANMNYELRYDPTVVRPEGEPLAGNLLRGEAVFEANPAQPGRIRIGFAGAEGLDRGGTLAAIPFRATGPPGSRTALTLVTPVTEDAGGGSLSIARVDGAIEILGEGDGGGRGPEGGAGGGRGGGPGDDPDAGAAGGRLPDCNGDGRLTALDADCALEMSVGKRRVDSGMDADGDGRVTSGDARTILQRARGSGR